MQKHEGNAAFGDRSRGVRGSYSVLAARGRRRVGRRTGGTEIVARQMFFFLLDVPFTSHLTSWYGGQAIFGITVVGGLALAAEVLACRMPRRAMRRSGRDASS